MSLKFRVLFVVLAVLSLPLAGHAARDDLRFADLTVETDSDTPSACFMFNRKLASHAVVHYEDYVRFEPTFEAAFTARGRQLCVSGMEYGRTYRATILEGLPDAVGSRTTRGEMFNVSVPDRKPSLAFSGASYILPSRGDRSLPLTAVNVAAADVKIMRINDRNLINQINSGRVSTLLSNWDTNRITSLAGETVWEGKIDIETEKNRTIKTHIPVGDILGQPEPGIYIVMAVPTDRGRGYYYYEATQWMVVSDIGMTSLAGRDGLHVFLRSLQDAKSLAGTRVQLIARNNEVLGEATTDARGMARFDPGLLRGKGGAQPGAVMAFGEAGEFNFLDLTKPAFDLTDRGVGGREEPGPIDGFVYTDRGVYRPGETVNIVALLRDSNAMAEQGLPLKLRFLKPDGTEHAVVDLGDDDLQGGYHHALALSKSANTGSWTVHALVDPEGPAVGTASFQVEDFVPERMEVTLSAGVPYLVPGDETEVKVDAQFLYGAPGAGLTVESELILMQDRNPWPEMKGYRFGLVQEEWRPRREPLDPVKTGSDGLATIPVVLTERPDTSLPLKARLRVVVEEEGGRAVSRFVDIPVRANEHMIGIRPLFDRDWLENGTEAGFDVARIDREGNQVAAKGLQYQFYYEHYRYRWYTEDGRWRYRVLIDDELVDGGSFDVAAGTPARLGFSRKWGGYRLEVSDPQTGAVSSARFRFGWFSAGTSADVPDKLQVTLKKPRYRVGETAKIHIRPPFAGELLLTVSGSKVYEVRNLSVPAEGMVVELPVKAEWDAGAYVTATLFRTAESGKPYQPFRAIGLAWLGRDYGERVLDVAIDAPERMLPRQTIDIGVSIGNLTEGETAHLTLAAVDVGILQLTNYKTPKPDDWYFGKRRLGMEIRDGYGYLIAAAEGAPVTIRSGGDAAAAGRHLGGLDASSVKTVSLFSGVVTVGADGRASVPLDVPDFNGRLRLMAVAWTKSAVGSAEFDMTVRDPVVTQVTLPRFLAPGDEARVTLSVHNLDGPEGEYRISFDGTGAVAMTGEDEPFVMNRDERNKLTWKLSGEAVGVGALALSVEGPEGFRLLRDWQIAVRPAQAVASRQITSRIQSGQSSTLTASILDDFVPGTAEALITLSPRPDMGLPDLLKSLARYPYGCAEQTTSKAFPLLYVAEIARSLGISEDPVVIRARVQDAIHRLFTMQRSDGSFGLWNSQSPREEWLSAYVMDFLTQAKELDYAVPSYSYERGLQWLKGSAAEAVYNRSNMAAKAYAFYVLARAGQAELSDLRYIYDTQFGNIPTALAQAQLGAALALMGERQRANQAFRQATRSWSRSHFWSDWRYWDYGTSTRDMAATVYLATHAKVEDVNWFDYALELGERVKRDRYFSTQEKAWLVLAAHELGAAEPIRVSLRGKSMPPSDKPVYLSLRKDEIGDGVEVGNHGDKPIWQSIAYSGVPRDPMLAEDEGFAVFRAYYTLDGRR